MENHNFVTHKCEKSKRKEGWVHRARATQIKCETLCGNALHAIRHSKCNSQTKYCRSLKVICGSSSISNTHCALLGRLLAQWMVSPISALRSVHGSEFIWFRCPLNAIINSRVILCQSKRERVREEERVTKIVTQQSECDQHNTNRTIIIIFQCNLVGAQIHDCNKLWAIATTIFIAMH